MDEHDMRMAMAVLAGWTNLRQLHGWYGVAPGMQASQPIPDYPRDLNAVHELVRKLRQDPNSTLWAQNQAYLEQIVMRDQRVSRHAVSFQWEVSNATALQRTEAYLRTVRYWTGPEVILDPEIWDENGNVKVKIEDLFK
jgi:hypothetical protein